MRLTRSVLRLYYIGGVTHAVVRINYFANEKRITDD
jgi:hypothetical protein